MDRPEPLPPQAIPSDRLERKLMMAESYMGVGRVLDAEELLREALELDPQNVGVRNALACILWQSGRVVGAFLQLSKALGQEPYNRDVVWNSGQIFYQMGRQRDAFRVYRKYLSRHPQDDEIANALAGWEGIAV